MGLFDAVSQALKDAMLQRDRVRIDALRAIRAAFLVAAKRDGSQTLADGACIPLLRRLAKQHGESISAFEAGGRMELVEKERAELAVVEAYLPRLADESTTRGWVEEAIAATGAAAPKDLGRVMGVLIKSHRTDVDAALARQIAERMLSS